MSARYCPFCGQPVVPGGSYCPSCGATLAAGSPLGGSGGWNPPATAGWAAPSIAPVAPYSSGFPGTVGSPTPSSLGADRRALTGVSWAAVLSLVGTVVGLVALFGTPALSYLGVTTSPSGTTVSLSLSALYRAAFFSGFGLLLALGELALYRQAFHTLAPHDGRFSTPSSLVLLAVVAVVIFLAGGVFVVINAYHAIRCAGVGNPIGSTCLNLGTLLTVLAVVGIAAILALVGYIGLLVGIWRLGTRYREGMFKVGAVLLLVPLLNLIAAILILVAARSARGRLDSGPASREFG